MNKENEQWTMKNVSAAQQQKLWAQHRQQHRDQHTCCPIPTHNFESTPPIQLWWWNRHPCHHFYLNQPCVWIETNISTSHGIHLDADQWFWISIWHKIHWLSWCGRRPRLGRSFSGPSFSFLAWTEWNDWNDGIGLNDGLLGSLVVVRWPMIDPSIDP